MKKLHDLASLADSIEKDVNLLMGQHSNGKIDRDTIEGLKAQVAELTTSLHRALRPELDNVGRHKVVNHIVSGLIGFGSEQGAKLASNTYTVEWFRQEHDVELKRLLCEELIAKFGSSPNANTKLWNTFL